MAPKSSRILRCETGSQTCRRSQLAKWMQKTAYIARLRCRLGTCSASSLPRKAKAVRVGRSHCCFRVISATAGTRTCTAVSRGIDRPLGSPRVASACRMAGLGIPNKLVRSVREKLHAFRRFRARLGLPGISCQWPRRLAMQCHRSLRKSFRQMLQHHDRGICRI